LGQAHAPEAAAAAAAALVSTALNRRKATREKTMTMKAASFGWFV
jgi:hypothetical protein